MISVQNLVKRYGRIEAVGGVSFDVGRGEVVGFLGPNGAGKTTTLRIIAGFLGMTSGVVTVAGHDVERSPNDARRSLGYMPEAVPLYPEMRVGEYLAFRAELKGVARGQRTKAVGEAMERARVDDRATTLIGHLSKGYRQRVGLADALVARPPILVLDEPTAGLDPNQIREVRALVKDLGGDHTVLVSTHILGEVEATCGRALLLAQGKLVAQGTLDELRALREPRGARVRVRGESGAVDLALKGQGTVEEIRSLGQDETVIRVTGSAEDVVALLVAAGFGVREVRPEGGSLEDVFAALTNVAAGASGRRGAPS